MVRIVGDSEQRGSISPLIVAFFSILMIAIFVVSNAASVYVGKRELTSLVESSLATAAQQLDELTYYYGSPLTDFLTDSDITSGKARVPIECDSARSVFERTLTREVSALNGNQILTFNCNGSELWATVSSMQTLPFQIRALNLNSFKIEVSAATSSFLLTESE